MASCCWFDFFVGWRMAWFSLLSASQPAFGFFFSLSVSFSFSDTTPTARQRRGSLARSLARSQQQPRRPFSTHTAAGDSRPRPSPLSTTLSPLAIHGPGATQNGIGQSVFRPPAAAPSHTERKRDHHEYPRQVEATARVTSGRATVWLCPRWRVGGARNKDPDHRAAPPLPPLGPSRAHTYLTGSAASVYRRLATAWQGACSGGNGVGKARRGKRKGCGLPGVRVGAGMMDDQVAMDAAHKIPFFPFLALPFLFAFFRKRRCLEA
ncbi:hypothetical protein HDK77DRAFT_502190 [Phyllosticta capitalensis]